MWPISIKQALVAGVVATGVGAATVGYAVAQSGQERPERPPHSHEMHQRADNLFQSVAAKLGIDVDRLRQAMQEARAERHSSRAGDPRRPREERENPGMHPGRFGIDLQTVVPVLGITLEQLRQEIPGKSLADVALAHGKNPADVSAAIVGEANRLIDRSVANGHVSPEGAERLKQRLTDRIDTAMNRVVPERLFERAPRGERAA